VKLLLDTHALLWFLLNDPRLSDNARRLVSDTRNDLLISPASYWEIAIKISLGKYTLTQDFESFMQEQVAKNDLRILPITIKHAAVLAKLPFHHRDPFDRLLVAQAICEQIPLVSGDVVFDKYSVARTW